MSMAPDRGSWISRRHNVMVTLSGGSRCLLLVRIEEACLLSSLTKERKILAYWIMVGIHQPRRLCVRKYSAGAMASLSSGMRQEFLGDGRRRHVVIITDVAGHAGGNLVWPD